MLKNAGKIWLAIFLLILLPAVCAYSQENESRPKIGIALSGGGAKGLAHIGVLKVLEETGIPIDYISGTSMGSIVGALYAIGYRADELERLALSTDWPDLLTDEMSRRYIAMEEKIWDGRYIGSFPISNRGVQLPSGLIAGQKISNFLSRLTWSVHHINDFSQLPIPFSCVAADIATGEAVPIDSGFLPDAIRASMAIPTVFTPVKFQGRLLVDGGLVRNLPAEDVKRMGADIIIGVDVSFALLPLEDIQSFLDIITQSLSFVEAQSRERQYQICDILIQPDMRDITLFSFNDVEDIINRGEQAARKILPELQDLVDSFDLEVDKGIEFIPAKVDSIYIKSLRISGLHDVSRRMVLAETGLSCPCWISAKQLDQAITRLYSSRFFERVTYKLIPSDKGSDLIIRVIEKSTNLFRFGFRYDTDFESSLLLNTTLKNLAEHGSNLVLDLRLGEKTLVDLHYFLHTGYQQRFGLHARMNYTSQIFDIYNYKQRESSLRIRSASGELLFGSIFSSTAIVGLGIKGEYDFIKIRIGTPAGISSQEKFLALYGLIRMDTFDRTVFPSRGQLLMIRSTYASESLTSTRSFAHHLFDWKIYYPIDSKLSLLSRFQLGTATGEKIPLSHKFFLGGADSFLGLKFQERFGRHLQAIQLGFQYEVLSKRFLLFRWNIGNTSDRWKNLFIRNRPLYGYGITAGAATPIGPLELTLMGGSQHRLLFYFNLGYKF